MSIKEALFSDSQAKVYLWIFGQPQRAYHLSELRRLTGLGSASLQREINRLVDAQLAVSVMVGNQRQIAANPNSPVFNELCALARKVVGIAPMLLEALVPMAEKVTLAFIYGSVAKETDTAGSDVDIMLVGNNLMLGEVLEQLAPAEEALSRKVNPTCYTVEEFQKRLHDPDSFVNRVLNQPTIQLIGDVDAFRSAQ
ncbi:MAG: nucleotidyltransferase domain-containing protein [Fluviibacter sp.]